MAWEVSSGREHGLEKNPEREPAKLLLNSTSIEVLQQGMRE